MLRRAARRGCSSATRGCCRGGSCASTARPPNHCRWSPRKPLRRNSSCAGRRAGLADSTLLVVRELAGGRRSARDRFAAQPRPRTRRGVPRTAADTDFADLFSVKEGRTPLGGAEMTVLDGELMLRERIERVHDLSVTASGDPSALTGSLRWRIVMAPGRRWQTEIVAQPTRLATTDAVAAIRCRWGWARLHANRGPLSRRDGPSTLAAVISAA